MNYGYIRISKDTSDTANQVSEIETYVSKNNLESPTLLKEIVSGKKSANDRQLGQFIHQMKANDILIVSSFSRLGRDIFDVVETLKIIIDKSIRLITIQENREFSNNLESKMFAMFYAIFAEIERDFTIQRNRASIARQKADGTYTGGRPKDSMKAIDERQMKEFNKAIERGENRKEVLCKMLEISRPTLNKFLLNNPDIEAKRAANQPSARKNA